MRWWVIPTLYEGKTATSTNGFTIGRSYAIKSENGRVATVYCDGKTWQSLGLQYVNLNQAFRRKHSFFNAAMFEKGSYLLALCNAGTRNVACPLTFIRHTVYSIPSIRNRSTCIGTI